MLVLTRKLDESIVIDGRITITVVEIRGGRIKLGIKAPKEVGVRRSKLEDATANGCWRLSELHHEHRR